MKRAVHLEGILVNASPQIVMLLDEILKGGCDRSSLAKWLAESSLLFSELPNKLDRMIVSDLDAALGEIQGGRQTEEFLLETANKLVNGLGLVLPSRQAIVDMSGSRLEITLSSTNIGGDPMASLVVELVPQSA